MSSTNKSTPALFSPTHRSSLQRQLLRWYARHSRALPWRDVDNSYYVLVSEFMLQQTQVARVLDHFPRWIARFPDVSALAAASRRDVLVAWSGMGYNRRALHLHAAAKSVMAEHRGRLPTDPAALRKLPGVGRYTAHAVACFGHRKRHALVDINIRRVLSRLSETMPDTSAMLPEPESWRIAADLLPARAFYNWNQALMDLGATICTARMPGCDRCPLRSHCKSAGKLAAPPPVLRAQVRETPRRIYRGRVVELLRNARNHCSSAREIGQELFDPFTPEMHPRLIDILATLEADSMIAFRAERKPVTDIRSHSGPLERLRICLVE